MGTDTRGPAAAALPGRGRAAPSRPCPRYVAILCLLALLAGSYRAVISSVGSKGTIQTFSRPPPASAEGHAAADDLSHGQPHAWTSATNGHARSSDSASATSQPVPSATALPLSRRKFLVTLSVFEGFGAWSDGILESLELAKRLGRAWVEPCVRNGCIEPCRCGHIGPVTPWSPEAEAAAAEVAARHPSDVAASDPLLLPFIPYWCKVDFLRDRRPNTWPEGTDSPPPPAETYPLSAYLDVGALDAEYGPGLIVTYDEWCNAFGSGNGTTTVDDSSGRGTLEAHPVGTGTLRPEPAGVRLEPAANVSNGSHEAAQTEATPTLGARFQPADPASGRNWQWPVSYSLDMAHQFIEPGKPIGLGDFLFGEETRGRFETREAGMQVLASDTSQHLFIHAFYRGYIRNLLQRTVPINKWHIAAVQRFIAARFGGGPYVAFHWRSEQVDPAVIPECAKNLSAVARRALPQFFPSLPPVDSTKISDGSPTDPPGTSTAVPSATRAMLLADMPGPGNKNRAWDDYAGGEDPRLAGAMTTLVAAGFMKYDSAAAELSTMAQRHSNGDQEENAGTGVARGTQYKSDSVADAFLGLQGQVQRQGVDAGVLSIRDYLFALYADWYVTCQDGAASGCRGCFRTGSNFVQRIHRDRMLAGRPTSIDWFGVDEPEAVPCQLLSMPSNMTDAAADPAASGAVVGTGGVGSYPSPACTPTEAGRSGDASIAQLQAEAELAAAFDEGAMEGEVPGKAAAAEASMASGRRRRRR